MSCRTSPSRPRQQLLPQVCVPSSAGPTGPTVFTKEGPPGFTPGPESQRHLWGWAGRLEGDAEGAAGACPSSVSLSPQLRLVPTAGPTVPAVVLFPLGVLLVQNNFCSLMQCFHSQFNDEPFQIMRRWPWHPPAAPASSVCSRLLTMRRCRVLRGPGHSPAVCRAPGTHLPRRPYTPGWAL